MREFRADDMSQQQKHMHFDRMEVDIEEYTTTVRSAGYRSNSSYREKSGTLAKKQASFRHYKKKLAPRESKYRSGLNLLISSIRI